MAYVVGFADSKSGYARLWLNSPNPLIVLRIYF